MSSNRLIYDSCAYKKNLQQSIPLMGFPTGTDMNLLFDGMKKTISQLKDKIDKS